MLLRLIDWYLKRRGFQRVRVGGTWDWVSPRVKQLTLTALPLVQAEEPKPQSGEFKRHQVYARLLKDFPEVDKKDVSQALERAVRKMQAN